jgi:pilus assembly protein CpaE
MRSAADKTALVICPTQEMMSEIVPLLTHNLAGVHVVPAREYPDAEALPQLTGDKVPRLCFLDVATDAERAQAVMASLLAVEPGIQIVVLLGSNLPDLILRCLRQGATEFLIQPFTAEDLKPVLARLSQLSPTMSYGKGAKVICVAPTKGACGASTIAANLAYQRKRLGSEKMLLADLDPLSGTISFLLKLRSSYSFLDALSRSTTLDEDLWKGLVTVCNGVDVLLSPDNPMDSVNELQDPTPIIEFARQLYDTVIIDCANVFGDWGLALAAICDEFLLVTTNELPALQATQRILAHLDRNRVERSKLRLVVNRYSREVGLSKGVITSRSTGLWWTANRSPPAACSERA